MKTTFDLEIKPIHGKFDDGSVEFEGGTLKTTLEISVEELKENHNVILMGLEKVPTILKSITNIFQESATMFLETQEALNNTEEVQKKIERASSRSDEALATAKAVEKATNEIYRPTLRTIENTANALTQELKNVNSSLNRHGAEIENLKNQARK